VVEKSAIRIRIGVPGPELWPSPSRELAYGAKNGSITIRILGLPKFQVTVEGPIVKNEDVINVLPGQGCGTPREVVTDEYSRFGRMTNNREKSKKFGEKPTPMPICRPQIFFLLALQPPTGVVFYSPLAGFSLLACEVLWSHTTTRHSR